MSLAIETDNVTHVLLADGWHEVAAQSFDLDSYEFMWGDLLVHGGGNSGVCAAGFTFVDQATGMPIQGPLTSVLAVRTEPSAHLGATP